MTVLHGRRGGQRGCRALSVKPRLPGMGSGQPGGRLAPASSPRGASPGDSPVVWPQSSPAPLTHVPPSVMGKPPPSLPSQGPTTQVAGGGALWALTPAAREQPAPSQRSWAWTRVAADRLLCPGSSIPCHQGQAASPLKRQSWRKCRGVGVRGKCLSRFSLPLHQYNKRRAGIGALKSSNQEGRFAL